MRRRHGISASLVFTWRRQSRANPVPAAVVPRFTAVRIAEASTETVFRPRANNRGLRDAEAA